MIVICTGCQARFRVADDKVGPRGAKVRCSRCQTVFLVRREPDPLPPAPKIELDLAPATSGPAMSRPPEPAGAAVGFPSEPPQRGQAPDPFAAAGFDTFGEPGPAAAADPFAAPSSADPFASSGVTGSHQLPVTDLSQLLGTSPPAPAPVQAAPSFELPAPAAPAPEPISFEPPPPPSPSPEPVFFEEPPPAAPAPASFAPPVGAAAEPDPFADPFDVAPAPPPRAPPLAQPSLTPLPFVPPPPPPEAPAPEPEERSSSGGLALEDRSSPGMTPFADPDDVVSGEVASAAPAGVVAAAGGGFGRAGFEAGPLDGFAGPGPEESLQLATEPAGGQEPQPAPAEAPPPEPERAQPPRAARQEARREAARPARPPVHPLRSAGINALALVALVVIALGFRALLRGDAAGGPSALRPSMLLRALGGPRPADGPFAVEDVRSRLYRQTSGGTLLYVRGEVVSRAPGPVPVVRVEAELVRGGQVLARGEARVGAVPTPEEVDRAIDRTALEELAAAAAKRAPATVSPGDRLGFLVTLGDAPADVTGASVRVRARADGAGP